MSYKENLYNKALHEIERIYVESKYDSDMDFYRIFDIINSINDNQMANKEWLVDKLLPYIDPKGADICILGGWYGLTALMLRQHLPEEIEIDNVDCDIWCSRIARRLNDGAKNIRYATDNAEDWFFDKPRKYQLIINTIDGKVYNSKPTQLTQVTPISDVYAERTTDGFNNDGMAIYVDSYDPTNNSNYYRHV